MFAHVNLILEFITIRCTGDFQERIAQINWRQSRQQLMADLDLPVAEAIPGQESEELLKASWEMMLV